MIQRYDIGLHSADLLTSFLESQITTSTCAVAGAIGHGFLPGASWPRPTWRPSCGYGHVDSWRGGPNWMERTLRGAHGCHGNPGTLRLKNRHENRFVLQFLVRVILMAVLQHASLFQHERLLCKSCSSHSDRHTNLCHVSRAGSSSSSNADLFFVPFLPSEVLIRSLPTGTHLK